METPEGSGKSPHGLNNRKLDKTIVFICWKEILQYSDTRVTMPSEHCVAITNNILKMHFLIQRFRRVLANEEAASFLCRSSPCGWVVEKKMGHAAHHSPAFHNNTKLLPWLSLSPGGSLFSAFS